MAFMAPLAIAGLAMSAAGAAANFAQQRAQQQHIDDINKRTRAAVERNRLEAQAVLDRATKEATPEAQAQSREEKAAQLGTAMENAAAGTAEPSIVKTTDESPKIVATETAKQLGTALDKAKQQMAMQAQLGAWAGQPNEVAFDLSRSGEKIGQLANFSAGSTNAALQDIQSTQQGGLPIGDILQGVGGAAMGASGAGGMGLGDKLFGAGNWLTTPIKNYGQMSRLVAGTPAAGDLSAIF